MTTSTSSSRRTNRSNPAFEKSLAFLAHPLSLSALGLILLNDQLLRRLWPSWITGKLSDAGWLFVVPFALAALLSWALSRRWGDRAPFALAYALTGLSFLLVKTVDPLNLLAGRTFLALTGLRPALALDPSDLLTLPALFLSLGWWLRGLPPETRRAPAWRTIALPLAALVLMADAPAPDHGIVCFTRDGNNIYAKAAYSSMVSADGGQSWTYSNQQPDCSEKSTAVTDPWQETPGPKDGTVYRYRSGDSIQISTDGGKTWTTAYQLHPTSEAERVYIQKSHQGNPLFVSGPLDAIADPATGNMIFAMGQQGVLVHKASGEWAAQGAGSYQPVTGFPTTDAFAMLMGGTAVMAVGLALLVAASLALRWTGHWLRYSILAIAWIGWVAVDVIFPPGTADSYTVSIAGLGIAAAALFLIPLLVEQTVRLVKRAPRALLPLFGFGLAAGLLYMVPYLLWLYNLVTSFGAATGIGLILGLVALAAGIFWARNQPRFTAPAPVG